MTIADVFFCEVRPIWLFATQILIDLMRLEHPDGPALGPEVGVLPLRAWGSGFHMLAARQTHAGLLSVCSVEVSTRDWRNKYWCVNTPCWSDLLYFYVSRITGSMFGILE